MGEEYSVPLMAVPSAIATAPRLNCKPPTGKQPAGSRRMSLQVLMRTRACLCLGNYSRSSFPPAEESRGIVWLQSIQIPLLLKMESSAAV